jgi:hypothetical protein
LFEWCAARLDHGYGPVAFCHATGRDDGEYILVDSPIAHYRGAFADVAEPTVVVGHTHTGRAAAVLRSAARDLPGIESFTGNVRTPASDDEALKAFTLSVRLQVRER